MRKPLEFTVIFMRKDVFSFSCNKSASTCINIGLFGCKITSLWHRGVVFMSPLIAVEHRRGVLVTATISLRGTLKWFLSTTMAHFIFIYICSAAGVDIWVHKLFLLLNGFFFFLLDKFGRIY